jgi:hypothetical protein
VTKRVMPRSTILTAIAEPVTGNVVRAGSLALAMLAGRPPLRGPGAAGVAIVRARDVSHRVLTTDSGGCTFTLRQTRMGAIP